MAKYYDGYDWDIDGFPGEYVYGDHIYVDDYYMDERWKRDEDNPDYWVSNKGRVWSTLSQKFIGGSPNKQGYIDFSMKQDGKRSRGYLHRMMAKAFIPNPHNYPEVRHLDDNRENGELENLAWGTQLDNTRDCIRNGHFRYFSREDIERANEIRRTPIVAVRLRDGKKQFFISQGEACRQLGIDQSSISAVIRKQAKSAGGYYFVLQDEYDDSFDPTAYKYQRKGIPVEAININTGETLVFDKPRYAAFELGISEASVSNILRGKNQSAKGWTFRYLEEDDDVESIY